MRAGYEVIKRRIETLIAGDASLFLADWPVQPIVVTHDRGIAITAEFREWEDYGSGEATLSVRVVIQNAIGDADTAEPLKNYHDVEAVAELIRNSTGKGRRIFAAYPGDAADDPAVPAAYQWTLLQMLGGSETLDADRDSGFAVETTFDVVIQRP